MNKNHFLCVKRKKEDNKQHHMKRFLTFSPSINMLLLHKTAELKKKIQHTEKNLHSIFTTSHLAFYERWPFRYGIHFASLFHCLTLDKQLNRFLVLILLAFFLWPTPFIIYLFFFSFFYTQLCDRSWICT